jgi:hypothetical protein
MPECYPTESGTREAALPGPKLINRVCLLHMPRAHTPPEHLQGTKRANDNIPFSFLFLGVSTLIRLCTNLLRGQTNNQKALHPFTPVVMIPPNCIWKVTVTKKLASRFIIA